MNIDYGVKRKIHKFIMRLKRKKKKKEDRYMMLYAIRVTIKFCGHI